MIVAEVPVPEQWGRTCWRRAPPILATPLFESGLVNSLMTFDVYRGGQRFVMGGRSQAQEQPISVILNWVSSILEWSAIAYGRQIDSRVSKRHARAGFSVPHRSRRYGSGLHPGPDYPACGERRARAGALPRRLVEEEGRHLVAT